MINNVKGELPGKGLTAGEWDITCDILKTEGNKIHQEKGVINRIVLIKNTTWKEISKILPKGSIITNCRHVR